MKRRWGKIMWGVVVALAMAVPAMGVARAEDMTGMVTRISISPVSKIIELEPNTTYEDSFKVTNNGDGVMDFEVYAAPYAYSWSEEDGEYRLGFDSPNEYTQITQWITIRNTEGEYVERAEFRAQLGESIEVNYRVATPAEVPSGGQYAVIFAHTLSGYTSPSGIKTEASPGMVIYGRNNEGAVAAAEFREKSGKTLLKPNENVTLAGVMVKNVGNVDFMAQSKYTIKTVSGQEVYTNQDDSSPCSRLSIIPGVELELGVCREVQLDTGLYLVEDVITAAGETETYKKIILVW